MKRKQSNKVLAWFLTTALCFSSFFVPGEWAVSQANDVTSKALSNPVIDAEEGKVVWDSIYFGNYWQSKYIPQPGNRPSEGEDDVVHQDEDGTKFIVRKDKSCYRYDPIKWRVLSVSEDGTNAFLVAEDALDVQKYHDNEEQKETVTWENSTIRKWLNDSFMNTAFTAEEQSAIVQTEIDNKKHPYAKDDVLGDGNNTTDKIYLLSFDEVTNDTYGFTKTMEETQTRCAENTDYVESGGTIKSGDARADYWLRTLGTQRGRGADVSALYGDIAKESTSEVDDTSRTVRPVLHLDLTKTGCWSYAGKVRQDKVEFAPDATPVVPTMSPTQPPSVTMAPGQTYPKNPEISTTDLTLNTWDCIYFGNYYNTKITPSTLSQAGDDDVVKTDENNNKYLTRREQGYFKYEPIKWRVLSINEDGTDAFLMADKIVDLAKYFADGTVEITWEKSDVRYWLNSEFINKAFTESEKSIIKDTKVSTADNKWSGEAGGNDTIDKIYLPSIEEMLEPSYGFSSDEKEEDTRRAGRTEYADKGGTARKDFGSTALYWLRSQGMKKGYPVKIGHWGSGYIPTEMEIMEDHSAVNIGVRPVMHVDLSDTSMWKYAGKVTPKGVVVGEKEDDSVTPTPAPTDDPAIDEPTEPTDEPGVSETPAPTDDPEPTEEPSDEPTIQPQIKKPAKPSIKQLKNEKGKKVKVTLTKKISGATGYQVAYATKSSMKGQKVKSFKGTSVTISGLKKNKTYYFRVRAYKKQSGKTVYSSWGSIKKIKIKK